MTTRLETETLLAHLEPAEIGYIAGLFDSSGMVTLFRKSGREHSYHLRVAIFHYDMQLVNWLLDVTGIGQRPQRTRRTNHGEEWRLRLPEVPVFLREVRPFVVMRRPQIDTALAYLDGYEPFLGGASVSFAQAHHRKTHFERLIELNEPHGFRRSADCDIHREAVLPGRGHPDRP